MTCTYLLIYIKKYHSPFVEKNPPNVVPTNIISTTPRALFLKNEKSNTLNRVNAPVPPCTPKGALGRGRGVGGLHRRQQKIPKLPRVRSHENPVGFSPPPFNYGGSTGGRCPGFLLRRRRRSRVQVAQRRRWSAGSSGGRRSAQGRGGSVDFGSRGCPRRWRQSKDRIAQRRMERDRKSVV